MSSRSRMSARSSGGNCAAEVGSWIEANHPRIEGRKKNAPTTIGRGIFLDISLTMSYFHTGIRTIIGAEAFHCPVRDGKEWDHLAMVIRLNLSPHHPLGVATNSQSQNQLDCVPINLEDRHNSLHSFLRLSSKL